MGWCFAIVNDKLAEIYFDKTKSRKLKIRGYCYVKRDEYKTTQEQKWIRADTAKVKLTYRKGKYYDQTGNLKI